MYINDVYLLFTVCVFYVKQLQNNHIFQIHYFFQNIL